MSDIFPQSQPAGGPLYTQVKRLILDAIRDGRWKPGEMLPSEQQLATEFSVSQGTLRKAIDELVAQKLIVRQQGKGSFIATHTRDHSLFYFSTWWMNRTGANYPKVCTKRSAHGVARHQNANA